MRQNKFKETIQDCNINFLLGSGLSFPYIKTLGNIEILLTELENKVSDPGTKRLIRASLYKNFFDGVIGKNLNILGSDATMSVVLEQYRYFLKAWNAVLLKRKVTLLSKEINLFTTNVDIFLEKALEDLHLEYNDGFHGRFRPIFSLSNFKKSHFKKSLHYDNVAELPVFNLLKLHGSLSWQLEAENVVFSRDLGHVKAIANNTISPDHILDIPDDATIETLVTNAAGKTANASTDSFMDAYEKLLIVINPTKDKFKHTLMNQTYYELLRLYSNELEKENTVLFVMGFSFADEHIREITLRAANSNPTLQINVFAHTSAARSEIVTRFGAHNIKNNNIEIIAPEQEQEADGTKHDKFKYDFSTLNKQVFGTLVDDIGCNDLMRLE